MMEQQKNTMTITNRLNLKKHSNNTIKVILSGVLLSLLITATHLAHALEFKVSADKKLFDKPYSTRLYIIVTDNLKAEPRTKVDWFSPPPMYVVDVNHWAGQRAITLKNDTLSYPPKMNDLPKKIYRVQAVLRTNPDAPSAMDGEGNLISEPINIELDGSIDKVISLKLVKKIPPRKFKQTKRIKAVHFSSPSLSQFYARDYKLHAGISLPVDYDPQKHYPVLYMVTGFGGTYHNIHRAQKAMGAAADELILVIPDASNYLGHSVFVDSENTGPWGQALVHELIPFIEKKYGGMGAKHRYLTGVSSGGWSSLWLQVTYPDEFNGVWAMVPDPVDFHNFQNINLYHKGENMFYDANGNKRPLARFKGKVMLWYKDFVQMEQVLGPGGQIHSFEATFSHKSKNGKPELIFNRKTGAINHKVAQSWKPFDINHKLKTEWKTLSPKLKGKLHIYAGEFDTFYLEGAVRLLKTTLKELGSDAEVKIVPGMPHRPVPGIWEKISKAIKKQL